MSEMDYIIVPRIPRGLAPAVEGLAREILRQRPRNIYAFAAEHFAELVKLRDKERHVGENVVSKILQHKLLNKCDDSMSIVDRAKLNNDNNKNDVDVAESRSDDHLHNFHKYDEKPSTEEAMVATTREAKKSTTWKIATRKAAPPASKRKGERTGSGSRNGWSINRTVKALKQHHEYHASISRSDIEKKYEEDCNQRGLSGKEMEKVFADDLDYPDCPDYHHDSPRFSPRKDPFVRSSSAGNIQNVYRKRVKSREVGENLEKFYTVATLPDDKGYRNEKNLTRQRNSDADQIERTCVYFTDVFCTNEDIDVDVDVDRKRSRSLVCNNEGRNESNARQKARQQHFVTEANRTARDLKDEWKSVMEDQRKEQKKLREKFGDAAKEDDAKFSHLQLEKRNEKVSKETNEMGEVVVTNVESRPDLLNSNITFDESTNEIAANVGTISVVLPSVVGRRQSSGKCTRNNVVHEQRDREYESNGEDGAGNFTLPPISSDGSKSTRKGSDIVELPSLSNDVDARSNEPPSAIHHRHGHGHGHCEDSANSSRIQKRAESEKELFKLEGITVEIANSDYSRKAIEKQCKDQDSRDTVNVHDDTSVSWKYPRRSKSVEGSKLLLLTTDNIIEHDIDATQIPQQSGIIQRPRSSPPASLEAGKIRETLKDGLTRLTSDSVDLSEKTNSSKHLESEKENEKGEEEGNERQEERYRPNELERKLIEIETMEKSIENTLVSSRTTISNDLDNEFGESIDFLNTRNFKQEEDCARNGQVISRVQDEYRTKKNSDKSQNATSNENNGDDTSIDDNIEIDSIENETSNVRKRSPNFDSDNSETFVNESDNNSDDGARGIDVSCYVLTEGSPCEIPETVTTVIIPDKIVDNDDDNNVICKIELDDSTVLDEFGIPSSVVDSEIETKGGKHEEEDCQDYENPFGEYIVDPETVTVHYSSSVDAHFLRDVEDAADHQVAACQEDLANIKEEEENEGDQFSKVPQRSTVDCIAIDETLEKSNQSESTKRKKSIIECEAKLTSTSSSRGERQQNKMNSKEVHLSNISDPSPIRHDCAKHIARNDNSTKKKKNREEEERKTFDDRSSDEVSLSFEQVGPTINVPELNLDSLQDVTVSSSTIGESDSKNFLSNENGNVVVSSEDENISLSSFDALASSDNERRPNNNPNDESLPFEENDRARLFSEMSVTEMTKTERNETESCSEFQKTERFSNEKDDEKESSRYVEEEIARELIRNFIIDNTKAVESNDSMTSSSSLSSPKPRANNTKPNQAEDFVIQFHPSVTRDFSASKVAIGESSHREKLDNDTRADCEKGKGREKDEKTSEEGRQQEARENEASILPSFLLFFFSSFLLFYAPLLQTLNFIN